MTSSATLLCSCVDELEAYSGYVALYTGLQTNNRLVKPTRCLQTVVSIVMLFLLACFAGLLHTMMPIMMAAASTETLRHLQCYLNASRSQAGQHWQTWSHCWQPTRRHSSSTSLGLPTRGTTGVILMFLALRGLPTATFQLCLSIRVGR